MSHVIWHICGSVGEPLSAGTNTWPTWSKGAVIWRYELDDKQLEKKIEKRSRRMAEMIAEAIGGEVNEQTMVNGYCVIGIGTIIGQQELETPYASEYWSMQAFVPDDDYTDAQSKALKTRLTIERYQSYLDVYEVTGSEINTYEE